MGMGSARKGGRRGGGFRDINITPLVDVMLVLLIVFMVTAPLLTTGLRIDLPEVNAAQTPVKDARLLVTVTKDEKVLFGEEDVTSHIDQALKALKKKMQREGIFREMKLRGHYEKPSEKRARESAEAVRRARKLARKKMQREGLLPMKPRPVMGPGAAAGAR